MKAKSIQRLRVALLGLACACAAGFTVPAHAQITGTNQIAFTDFDTSAPGWSFGYYYSWNVPDVPPEPGTYEYTTGYTDPLLDPTNGPLVYRFAFTNTPYEGPVTTNAAGYGVGFGMPLNWTFDPAAFTSLELADYIISWDARVEGLKPGQTTANCEMQLKLKTGTPALQKNIGYNPGSNWTHFVYTLADGGFADGTTFTSFTNGIVTGITVVECAQNQHMPSDQFGFDEDNVVYLDNIKLEVLTYAGPPPPKVPLGSILDWNFDDKPVWEAWSAGTIGGWSANGVKATYLIDPTNAVTGLGGSNAFMFWMINEIYATNSPLPNWAGGNGGLVGPGDYSYVTSGDLSDYLLSMDARAEGMAPDTTAVSFDFQTRFNTSTGTLARIDTTFTGVSSNWSRVSLLLNKGSIGEGSKTDFAANYLAVTEMPVQVQLNNVVQSSLWQFDGDNKIFLDNLKLERLVVGCPPLNVQKIGNNVVVTWAQPATGSAKLQSSTAVNGTYADVIGATSPYPTPISGAPKYFRTQWIAPVP